MNCPYRVHIAYLNGQAYIFGNKFIIKD